MTEFREDDATPTARALVALELIHDRPGVSGEYLGERLGVSARAARRYVGILRQAGIPVESTPGRHGGYRMGRGYRVPPLMFSTDEALALVMAAVRGRLAIAGSEAVETALDKIVRVLPATVAGQAEAVRRVEAVGPRGDGPDPQRTSELAAAARDGVRLRLGYRTGPDRDPREMVVDPWGVHLRHDRWYLLCWSHTAGARRVLRLDRIESCTRLGETFEPPPGLDVVSVVDEHLSEGWGVPVVVDVDAAPHDVLGHLPRSLGRLEPLDAGRSRLVGSTDDVDWFAERLARLGVAFHVVEPDELRTACRTLGRRLLDAAGD
ncbi:WYL domain-containing protein [Nocardioides sp. C4-1]|uniref:helix-turn-helix transcriptional regulator n=1 Tax=Nocardioides sp. C4-1 TaxID=3151851 RepID=UPI0032650BFB